MTFTKVIPTKKSQVFSTYQDAAYCWTNRRGLTVIVYNLQVLSSDPNCLLWIWACYKGVCIYIYMYIMCISKNLIRDTCFCGYNMFLFVLIECNLVYIYSIYIYLYFVHFSCFIQHSYTYIAYKDIYINIYIYIYWR